MSDGLPRVTYSNTDVDFEAVHRKFDQDLPGFEAEQLGQAQGAIIGADRNVRAGTVTGEFSPFDNTILLGRFPYAADAVVDRAVAAAASGFKAWSARPGAERVAIIRKFSQLLSERRYPLAYASLYEVGKSRIEAIGEAEEAVDLPAYYAGQWEANDGYIRPLARVRDGESTESRLLPFGVFAVIAPFNFPIALSVNMIAAALITGNAVVFKPAPGCGLTGHMIVDAALDAGVPAGVINLIYGDAQTGAALVNHPQVAGVAFTGSHQVGMQLGRLGLAGKFAKPVIAEMGGKNPAYVTRSADIAVSAEGVARSAFGLQGQKCSACSVAYVDDAVYDDFVKALLAFTGGLKQGDPRRRDTFMGAVQSQATITRYDAAVATAKAEGKVLLGGARASAGDLAKGFFLPPTIVELPVAGRLTRDELFMPFLALRRMTSLEQGLAEGNAVLYGLAAGVYARDQKDIDTFLNGVSAGVVYANRASGATTGAWPGVQSFCGWKGSGITNKGGLGPYFLPQFMREQSRTIMASA